MSSELEIRCPACRARQTLRDACRRCAADLRLVARAHRRAAWVVEQRRLAYDGGDFERAQMLAAELEQLAPLRLTES
ncbi:MAG: hypothetical protein WD030_07935 [Pirellulales bacterium]